MPEIDLANGVFRYETPEEQAARRGDQFREAAQRILERHQQEQQAQDAETFSQNAHNYLEQTMQEDQRRQDFRSAAQGILDQAVNTGERRQQLDQADQNIGGSRRDEAARLLDQSGIPMSQSEREAYLNVPLERLQATIQQHGNLADLISPEASAALEGSPHYGPTGAPLPVVGGIPGFRTLPEAAATIGTAGIGSIGPAGKIGALIGGTGGATAGREVGGTPGEVIGGIGGALVGGAVGPAVSRRIGSNLGQSIEQHGGLGGFLQREQGGTKLPPVEPEPVAPPISDEPSSIPRPDRLKSIEQIAEDARLGSQNFMGGTAKIAGKLPPARGLVHTINPSALIENPPASIVKELGDKPASDLMANLLAYQRKTDQAASISSAIEDAIRAQTRKVGLAVQDGALANKTGVLGPVGDVFENPSRYNLTPPQRGFADQVHNVLEQMNQAEQAAGVQKGQVFSEEGRYFPRRVMGKGDIEKQGGMVRGAVGARQNFQRERFYETMQEGMSNGVNYGSDPAALVGTRIRAGIRAISDTELDGLVRALGRTGQGGPNIGEAGIPVPGLSGRYFPQDTAQLLVNTLNEQPVDKGLIGAVNTANSFLRQMEATGDLSYSAVQNLSTLPRNPGGFFKGIGAGVDSLILDGRLYGTYVEKNADQISRFVKADGIWNKSEFSFDEIAKSNLLKKTLGKLTGRFDRAFNNSANVTALENFKALGGIDEAVGPSKFSKMIRFAFGDIKGETSDEIAASIANKMSGRISSKAMGIGPVQREAESLLTFAPRFYRATFGMLGDAMQGGMRGAEARRVLLGLMGGAVASYVGVTRALGQPPKLDPVGDGAEFLTIKVGGQRVGFGGPMQGLIRAIASAASDPASLTDRSLTTNPALKWARGRTAPVLSLAIDLASGATYTGQQVKSLPETAKYLGEKALPFSLSSVAEEGPQSIVPQFLGLRSFPESPSKQFQRMFEEKNGRPFNPEVDYRVAQADPELAGMLDKMRQQGVDSGQAGAVSAQQTEDAQRQIEQEQHLPQIAQGVLSGDKKAGPAFVTAWSDFQSEMAGAFIRAGIGKQAADPQTPEGQAYAAWKAVKPQMNADYTMDWDAYFAQKDAAFAALPKDLQSAISGQLRALDPTAQKVEAQFEAARDIRKQLYTIPKYVGMSVDEAQAQDKFNQEVTQKATEVSVKLGYNVSDSVVADALAQQQGDPGLSAWYRALNSRRDELTNPAYTQFLQANQSKLETFFPDYYGTGFYEATGQVSPTNPYQRPSAPNPGPPSIRSQMEQAQQAQDVQGVLSR